MKSDKLKWQKGKECGRCKNWREIIASFSTAAVTLIANSPETNHGHNSNCVEMLDPFLHRSSHPAPTTVHCTRPQQETWPDPEGSAWDRWLSDRTSSPAGNRPDAKRMKLWICVLGCCWSIRLGILWRSGVGRSVPQCFPPDLQYFSREWRPFWRVCSVLYAYD